MLRALALALTVAGSSLAGSGCRARESAASSSSSARPLPTPSAEARVLAAPPASARGAELSFGDGSARFFVPAGVSNERRAPLALVLHGLGGDGPEIVAGLGLDAFARERGLILVAPNGKLDPQGRRFWNAGKACCNFSNDPVDDVARLATLIEHALRDLGADPERVFVIGYSNGGFMAHRLACSPSVPKLRAIVSLAASGPGVDERCEAQRAVAVLEIHGDRDPIVPIAGGPLFGRGDLPVVPGVELGLTQWARRAGCRGKLAPSARLDLVPEIAGEETEVRRFEACESPPLALWTVEGAGHVLPLGPRALEAIWNFLQNSGTRAASAPRSE